MIFKGYDNYSFYGYLPSKMKILKIMYERKSKHALKIMEKRYGFGRKYRYIKWYPPVIRFETGKEVGKRGTSLPHQIATNNSIP